MLQTVADRGCPDAVLLFATGVGLAGQGKRRLTASALGVTIRA
jgi:hypothetical protein